MAAWLPGSEGGGVADPLFGRRPYTGRLPVTWPRTLAQEPINVGDANYDPLYHPSGSGCGRGSTQRLGAARRERGARAGPNEQPRQLRD